MANENNVSQLSRPSGITSSHVTCSSDRTSIVQARLVCYSLQIARGILFSNTKNQIEKIDPKTSMDIQKRNETDLPEVREKPYLATGNF